TDSKNNRVNVIYYLTTSTTSLTLNPGSGSSGSTVTITGSGFASSSAVTLTFNGTVLATSPSTITTNTTGAFTATFTAPNYPAGNYNIAATDSHTNTVSSSFKLIPSLSLNPSTGPAGRVVTVTGSGFASLSAVTLTYDNVALTTSPGTITTDSSGSFTATFSVPSSASGNHNIAATDSKNNRVNVIYYLTTSTTSLTLNPGSGSSGSTVTITGSGFASSSAV
ncbi:MAG: IPT/TIG domain-containing protein, partial [Thaumarchaeota archaeon]|nr:IPT/TIG domain-containing protein [Nitrososphaerota archaeon]